MASFGVCSHCSCRGITSFSIGPCKQTAGNQLQKWEIDDRRRVPEQELVQCHIFAVGCRRCPIKTLACPRVRSGLQGVTCR